MSAGWEAASLDLPENSHDEDDNDDTIATEEDLGDDDNYDVDHDRFLERQQRNQSRTSRAYSPWGNMSTNSSVPASSQEYQRWMNSSPVSFTTADSFNVNNFLASMNMATPGMDETSSTVGGGGTTTTTTAAAAAMAAGRITPTIQTTGSTSPVTPGRSPTFRNKPPTAPGTPVNRTSADVYVRADGKKVRRVKKKGSVGSLESFEAMSETSSVQSNASSSEVYVRADGKKVRRVKKKKDNQDNKPSLTSPDYSPVTSGKQQRGVEASSSNDYSSASSVQDLLSSIEKKERAKKEDSSSAAVAAAAAAAATLASNTNVMDIWKSKLNDDDDDDPAAAAPTTTAAAAAVPIPIMSDTDSATKSYTASVQSGSNYFAPSVEPEPDVFSGGEDNSTIGTKSPIYQPKRGRSIEPEEGEPEPFISDLEPSSSSWNDISPMGADLAGSTSWNTALEDERPDDDVVVVSRPRKQQQSTTTTTPRKSKPPRASPVMFYEPDRKSLKKKRLQEEAEYHKERKEKPIVLAEAAMFGMDDDDDESEDDDDDDDDDNQNNNNNSSSSNLQEDSDEGDYNSLMITTRRSSKKNKKQKDDDDEKRETSRDEVMQSTSAAPAIVEDEPEPEVDPRAVLSHEEDESPKDTMKGDDDDDEVEKFEDEPEDDIFDIKEGDEDEEGDDEDDDEIRVEDVNEGDEEEGEEEPEPYVSPSVSASSSSSPVKRRGGGREGEEEGEPQRNVTSLSQSKRSSRKKGRSRRDFAPSPAMSLLSGTQLESVAEAEESMDERSFFTTSETEIDSTVGRGLSAGGGTALTTTKAPDADKLTHLGVEYGVGQAMEVMNNNDRIVEATERALSVLSQGIATSPIGMKEDRSRTEGVISPASNLSNKDATLDDDDYDDGELSNVSGMMSLNEIKAERDRVAAEAAALLSGQKRTIERPMTPSGQFDVFSDEELNDTVSDAPSSIAAAASKALEQRTPTASPTLEIASGRETPIVREPLSSKLQQHSPQPQQQRPSSETRSVEGSVSPVQAVAAMTGAANAAISSATRSPQLIPPSSKKTSEATLDSLRQTTVRGLSDTPVSVPGSAAGASSVLSDQYNYIPSSQYQYSSVASQRTSMFSPGMSSVASSAYGGITTTSIGAESSLMSPTTELQMSGVVSPVPQSIASGMESQAAGSAAPGTPSSPPRSALRSPTIGQGAKPASPLAAYKQKAESVAKTLPVQSHHRRFPPRDESTFDDDSTRGGEYPMLSGSFGFNEDASQSDYTGTDYTRTEDDFTDGGSQGSRVMSPPLYKNPAKLAKTLQKPLKPIQDAFRRNIQSRVDSENGPPGMNPNVACYPRTPTMISVGDDDDDGYIISAALARKRVRVVHLLVISLIGFLFGFMASFFVQSSCHFLSAEINVGENAVAYRLHYGMWKFSPIDSAFQEYSYCHVYDNEYTWDAPFVSRVFGLLAMLLGGFSLLVIWRYLISGKIDTFHWTLGVAAAVVACLFQSLTFLFFGGRMCSQHDCNMGPAGRISIVATFVWLFLAFEMWYNLPTAGIAVPSVISGVPENQNILGTLEVSDFSRAARAYWRRLTFNNKEDMPTLNQMQRNNDSILGESMMDLSSVRSPMMSSKGVSTRSGGIGSYKPPLWGGEMT